MKIRAALMTLVKVGVVTSGLAGCGATRPNKILADTPVLPYQAPDISEITGIDEPDADADEGTAPEQAPTK